MTFNRRFLYAALTLTLALLFHVHAPAQSENRSQTIKEMASLKKKLSGEKEKLFLSPSAGDRAAIAEFLKQLNTGLIRLLPRSIYDSKLTIHGGGAYYSSFFAQDTPPIDASFWVERNAPPLSHIKHLSRVKDL